MAGLVYEVSWTRLLTLYIGHSTAAAGAVVAAFLGGLALGAAAEEVLPRAGLDSAPCGPTSGWSLASRRPHWRCPSKCARWRAALVGLRVRRGGLVFPTVRLATCLAIVLLPAAALGATFPMAIRWFASDTGRAAPLSGALYALNTAGAAPKRCWRVRAHSEHRDLRTTLVGVAGSVVAAISVWLVQRRHSSRAVRAVPGGRVADQPATGKTSRRARAVQERSTGTPALHAPLARGDGARPFRFRVARGIAWTRILALVLGPTTCAFAAALAAVIAGVALGSAAGSWIAARTPQPAAWLSTMLALGAVATSYTYSLAGQRFRAWWPRKWPARTIPSPSCSARACCSRLPSSSRPPRTSAPRSRWRSRSAPPR